MPSLKELLGTPTTKEHQRTQIRRKPIRGFRWAKLGDILKITVESSLEPLNIPQVCTIQKLSHREIFDCPAMGPSSASRPLGSCQGGKSRFDSDTGAQPKRWRRPPRKDAGCRAKLASVEPGEYGVCFIPFSFLVGFFLEAFACRPWWTTCAEPYGKMQSVRALFPFSSSSAPCCVWFAFLATFPLNS